MIKEVEQWVPHVLSESWRSFESSLDGAGCVCVCVCGEGWMCRSAVRGWISMRKRPMQDTEREREREREPAAAADRPASLCGTTKEEPGSHHDSCQHNSTSESWPFRRNLQHYRHLHL